VERQSAFSAGVTLAGKWTGRIRRRIAGEGIQPANRRLQTRAEPPKRGRAQGQLASQPFFKGARGVWRTADTGVLAQDMAEMLGIPREEVGAKSFRIGGATGRRWR
jgi:hypothetical protein